MSQIVRVPGYGIARFPDGISKDEMSKAIREKFYSDESQPDDGLLAVDPSKSVSAPRNAEELAARNTAAEMAFDEDQRLKAGVPREEWDDYKWKNKSDVTPGEELLHEFGHQIQMLPETAFGEAGDKESVFGFDPAKAPTGQQITEKSASDAADSSGIPLGISVPVASVGKVATGLAQFVTSPKGIIQTATMAIPVAKIFQTAHFLIDLTKGGAESAGSLEARLEKFAKDPYNATANDFEGISDDTANLLATRYMAGHLSKGAFESLAGEIQPARKIAAQLKKQIDDSPIGKDADLPNKIVALSGARAISRDSEGELANRTESSGGQSEKLLVETIREVAPETAAVLEQKLEKPVVKDSFTTEEPISKPAPVEAPNTRAEGESEAVSSPIETVDNPAVTEAKATEAAGGEFPKVEQGRTETPSEQTVSEPVTEVSGTGLNEAPGSSPEVSQPAPSDTKTPESIATPEIAPENPSKALTPKQEFDKLALDYALQADIPHSDILHGDVRLLHAGAKSTHSAELLRLRRVVASELGIKGFDEKSNARVKTALPKLRAAAKSVGEVEGGVELLTGDEVYNPPVPKLGKGEKGTGDLFKGEDQPFNLSGEKALDTDRISADKAKAEQRDKEAKELDQKQQGELPVENKSAEEPLNVVGYNATTKMVSDTKGIYALIRTIKKRSGVLQYEVKGYGKNEGKHSDLEGVYEARGEQEAIDAAKTIAERERSDGAKEAKAIEQKQQPELTYEQKAGKIADALEDLFKSEGSGKLRTLPIDKVLEGAAKVAGNIIRRGGKLADAIAAAIKHVRDNHTGFFDEAAFEKKITDLYNRVMETPDESVASAKNAAKQPESESASGLMNAFTDQQREALDLPKRTLPEREYASQVFAKADSEMKKDPLVGPTLLASLDKDPNQTIDRWQQVVLLKHKVDVENANEAALKRVTEAQDAGNKVAEEKAALEVDELESQLERIIEISENVGTEAGRNLQFRKVMMNRDFTLSTMRMEARKSKGRKLEKEEEIEIKAQYEEIEAAAKAREEAEAEIDKALEEDTKIKVDEASKTSVREMTEEVKAKRKAQETVKVTTEKGSQIDARKARNKAIREAELAKIQGRPVTMGAGITGVESVLKEIPNVVSWIKIGATHLDDLRLEGKRSFINWKAEMKPYSLSDKHLNAIYKEAWKEAKRIQRDEITPAERRAKIAEQAKEAAADPDFEPTGISSYARELAKNFIEDGITEFDSLKKAVHSALQEAFPGISEFDAMRHMSRYGADYYRKATKEPVSVRTSQFLSEAQKWLTLERLRQEPPQRGELSGSERQESTPLSRKMTKEANDLARKLERLKKLDVSPEDIESQKASALDAVKSRMRNRIQEIRDELASGKRFERDEHGKVVLDAQGEALRSELDELKAERVKVFGEKERTPLTAEQKLARAEASAEANWHKWEKRADDARKGIWGKETPTPKQASEKITQFNAQRDAAKAEYEELKANSAEHQAAEAEAALTRKKESIEKDIAKREEELATGVSDKPGRKIDRPHPNKAIETLLQARDDVMKRQAEKRKESGKTPDSEKEAKWIESRLKRLNEMIDERLSKVASGDVSAKKPQVNRPLSAELEQAKQQLESVNSQLEDMRKQARVRPSPEELWVRRRVSGLLRREADYQKRQASKDFKPKTKPEQPKLTPAQEAELIKAQVRENTAKFEFLKARAQDKLDNLKGGELAKDRLLETLHLQQQIRSSFDLSFLRQAAPYALSAIGDLPFSLARGDLANSPMANIARATKKVWRSAWSEQKFQVHEQQLRNRGNYKNGNYKRSGLGINELDYHPDEVIRGRWGNKVPGLRGSNRAFSVGLNELRADHFDMLLESAIDKSPEAQKRIADLVNRMTGTVKPRTGEIAGTVQAVGRLIWSPKMLLSRLQLLRLAGVWRGPIEARKMAAMQYGKIALGAFTIYQLAQLAGAKKDKKGQLLDGNTHIDVIGGTLSTANFLYKVASLNAKQGDLEYFARGKSRPFVGTLYNFVFNRRKGDTLGNTPFGRNYLGHRITGSELLADTFLPMSWNPTDVKELLIENGIPKGMAYQAVNLLGFSVNVYDDNKNAKPHR